MRAAAPLVVACLTLLFALNRIQLTRGLDHFDPRNGDCLFWTEGAVQFRYARTAAEGAPIPSRDGTIQWPEGIAPHEELCLVMEQVIGTSYRWFAPLFGRPPFHVWAAYAPHVVAALAVPATYLAGLAVWGSAGAALLAAALYALSLATIARSIGSFGHEDFALPFLFLAAAFALRIAGRGDGARKEDGRAAIAVPPELLAGALAAACTAVALASWHFSRFAHLLLIAALGARILLARGPAAAGAARALAWLSAGAVLAGAGVPVLRASAFLVSPQITLSFALLAAHALARRGRKDANEMPAATSPPSRERLRVLGVFVAIAAPLLIIASRFSAERAGYGHVYALFLDKLRFLGAKPGDPALLSPEARSLWIEDFASPSLYLSVVMFAAPALLAVLALLHTRQASRRAAPSSTPAALAFDRDGLALACALALFTGISFLLVKRLFVLFAFYLAVVAGGAALFRARARARALALTAIVAALAFESHKITHHGGDTPLTKTIAAALKKPKPLAIPNWHANDLATVAWVRARTAPEDAFVARIGTSPMLLTYAGRPVVLHSKYEVPGIRERARAFGAALYGEEVDLYRFCRAHRAAYYLHEPRAALESGPDSERYVACATRLPKSSAAFRLQFAGEASRYFRPLYRNVSYCIYQVVDPADTAAAAATATATAAFSSDSGSGRARESLPAQPFYDIATFGGQGLDGDWFDDDATAAAVARVEEAIALLVQGQRELDAQRLERALPLLERAHALNPGLIGLNTYLGLVIALGGDYTRALPFCRRELAISPDLPFAYANLGFVEGNLGLYDDAIAHLSHAIAIDPANEGARVMLAQIEAVAAQRAK